MSPTWAWTLAYLGSSLDFGVTNAHRGHECLELELRIFELGLQIFELGLQIFELGLQILEGLIFKSSKA